LIDDEAEGGELAWTWVTRGISQSLETLPELGRHSP
jgi:hypothetical protein